MTPPPLVAALQSILDAELAAGNEIRDVGAGLPKCEVLIVLRKPFCRSYALAPPLEFVEINDPHYWKAEYQYDGGRQTLACGFDQ